MAVNPTITASMTQWLKSCAIPAAERAERQNPGAEICPATIKSEITVRTVNCAVVEEHIWTVRNG